MCGRYTLTIDKSTIEHRFGAKCYIAEPSYDWSPTFNAAPSQMLPIIRTHHSDRIELARWGFWPQEWKRNTRSRPMINARLETAGREADVLEFIPRPPLPRPHRRLLRVAASRHAQTALLTLKSGEPFAMAGIYAREPDGFETAEKNPVNFAILTTKANEAVAHIHDQMPVILPLRREKSWLPPNPTGMFMFYRIPAELLTSYPVTPKMNKASFNEPAAIAPLEPAVL
jgi:putative SOS response-associated peptidase YedK